MKKIRSMLFIIKLHQILKTHSTSHLPLRATGWAEDRGGDGGKEVCGREWGSSSDSDNGEGNRRSLRRPHIQPHGLHPRLPNYRAHRHEHTSMQIKKETPVEKNPERTSCMCKTAPFAFLLFFPCFV